MTLTAREQRIQWFNHDRFGMFIHWGLYAIPARGEWVCSFERISIEDYEKYFNSFNPVNYDPKAWAKAAKAAGMKYAVMTTKHHDGFCLFDSALTDYKATNTPAGRDLIREYADASGPKGSRSASITRLSTGTIRTIRPMAIASIRCGTTRSSRIARRTSTAILTICTAR